MVPTLYPTSAPTLSCPVTLPPKRPMSRIAPLESPNSPTYDLGRLIVRPVMVWLNPSKRPVNTVDPFPNGTNPQLLFQVLVALASMSVPSA